ncbi:glycosyltransferase family protein [Butyrivibrio fibrisolvens]|uniref:glycosyltransferase family protein n=1 Tax=Butyrivibrio fibrisolvens TaxID=831 RepID=UPI0004029A0A|nr:DUF3880 domain-containing protein [Butyrivibrio fibrisolvens]
MNILIYDLFGSFQVNDVRYYFEKMGHKCNLIQHLVRNRYQDEEFMSSMKKELENADYDFIFTTNYFPVVSEVCKKHNLPYVSWVYDSPPDIPDTSSMSYNTNRIFFFSRHDYEQFKTRIGSNNIYYLPLAVNTDRLTKIKCDHHKYDCDISFVGGLYFSDTFLSLRRIMSEEQQKFVDAVINVQLSHSGAGIIDASIDEAFTQRVCDIFLSRSPKAIQPSLEQLSFAMCCHITHIDRIGLLRLCGSKGYYTRLYTTKCSEQDQHLLADSGVNILGPVLYEEEMPQVFRCSKINLNSTTRANRSGIPLRVVDVLGSGGFLITNHQDEMDDFFERDTLVTYENLNEAVELIDYYMKHDDERDIISKRGYECAVSKFNYTDRLIKILDSL